jgi:hypothetical protein
LARLGRSLAQYVNLSNFEESQQPQTLNQNQTMEPLFMQSIMINWLGGLFAVVYFACIIAITIYVLFLLTRFVSAHERMATSLDVIARKLKDESKP